MFTRLEAQGSRWRRGVRLRTFQFKMEKFKYLQVRNSTPRILCGLRCIEQFETHFGGYRLQESASQWKQMV